MDLPAGYRSSNFRQADDPLARAYAGCQTHSATRPSVISAATNKNPLQALGHTAGDMPELDQASRQTLITGVCQLGTAKLLPGSALLLLLVLLPALLLASWLQVSLRPF
jgi:hypothetical protein